MADVDDSEDQPLKVTYNIKFWFFQTFNWLAYIFVTLIFIPWVLAMHIMLGLLAIPLSPLFCWSTGRNIFLYTYVITVMLPGKFIWFNFLRSNRRRGKVWDFEMGRPRPTLQNRRKLSISTAVAPQNASHLLTRLPPEIRLQIYGHVFVGNSSHLHIMQHKTPGSTMRAPKISIASCPCNLGHDGDDMEDISCNHPSFKAAIQSQSKTSDGYEMTSCGRLAILRSCRQVYTEAIDLLYNSPTFCFNSLAQPPFFPRIVLPHRLAQIRSIHLVYVQATMTKLEHAGCSTARFFHRVQQCALCNLIHWLDAIKENMTGLRTIEVFLSLDRKSEAPNLGKPWLMRLFDLQHGQNGLRELKIDVSPRGEANDLTSDAEYLKKIRKLDQDLQEKIMRGALVHHLKVSASRPMMITKNRTKFLEDAHAENDSPNVG